MKVKELPKNEMPREKLLLYGVDKLSNSDLLSIILRTGTKDNSVCEVSNNILKKVGDINNLKDVGIRELSNIKGVGNIKAITLLAAIELGKRVNAKQINLKMTLNNSYLINDAFKNEFNNLKQEKFLAIYLDNKKRLISYKTINIGTLDRSLVHPRDIFNEAIKVAASTIVVMHNHPSGILTPSKEDIDITDKLMKSGNMLSIPVIDHIITNGDDYYSFYEEKLKTIK